MSEILKRYAVKCIDNIYTGYECNIGMWCKSEDVEKLEVENTQLRAEQNRYRLALESLTPGGSEFVHDIEKCVSFVRETRDRHIRKIAELMEENKKLKDENKQLIRDWTANDN